MMFITKDRTDWQPLASVTLTKKSKSPAPAGIPEMTPAVDTDNPGGVVISLNVYGKVPPVAANAPEYDLPAVAAGSIGVLIVKPGQIIANGETVDWLPDSGVKTVMLTTPPRMRSLAGICASRVSELINVVGRS